jgi:Sulfotransferase domain
MIAAEMIWPNFFVVGAHKAGTTSLYEYLRKHPQVFLPAKKEPRYFTPEVRESLTLAEYQRLYEGAGSFAAIGDVTPFYLPNEKAPLRIREACPNARIIIMMRDPVARAHSHYLFSRQLGEESETSFLAALQRYEDPNAREWYLSREYVEHGMYYSQVKRYLDTFGKSQVLALLFDDLVKSPRELLAVIARHIGVNPGYFNMTDVSDAHNQYRMPKVAGTRLIQRLHLPALVPRPLLNRVRPLFFDSRKPSIDEEPRRLLQKMYDTDIAHLEELLGRRLPELRKSWI